MGRRAVKCCLPDTTQLMHSPTPSNGDLHNIMPAKNSSMEKRGTTKEKLKSYWQLVMTETKGTVLVEGYLLVGCTCSMDDPTPMGSTNWFGGLKQQ